MSGNRNRHFCRDANREQMMRLAAQWFWGDRIRSETIVGYGLPIERDGVERIYGRRVNVVGIHILQEMVVVNIKGGEVGVLSIAETGTVRGVVGLLFDKQTARLRIIIVCHHQSVSTHVDHHYQNRLYGVEPLLAFFPNIIPVGPDFFQQKQEQRRVVVHAFHLFPFVLARERTPGPIFGVTVEFGAFAWVIVKTIAVV